MFMQQSLLAPRVEHVVAEVNTKSTEVACQERDIFLIAVAGKGLNIGHPDIGLGQTDGSLSSLHLGMSRKNLWMCGHGRANTLLALARFLKFRNSRVQIQSGGEWQACQIVELQL